MLATFGEPQRTLGSGSNGSVMQYRRGTQTVAVKLESLTDELWPQPGFLMEASLRELRHPGITPILAAGIEGEKSFVVYPEAQMDLAKYQARYGGPSLALKRYLFQAAQGLAYLHGQGLIHGDIKPSNILIYPDGAKLGDFGTARSIAGLYLPPGVVLGTIWYRAPELLLGSTQLHAAGDVWALGCTMYEAWTQYYAFPAKPHAVTNQLEHILGLIPLDVMMWPEAVHLPQWRAEYASRPVNPQRLYRRIHDSQLIDLLEHIFVVNPEQRYTMLQVLTHPFFDEVMVVDVPLNRTTLPQLWPERQLPQSSAPLPPLWHRTLVWVLAQCVRYRYRMQTAALLLTILKHYLGCVRPETNMELLEIVFAAWQLIGAYVESACLTESVIARLSRNLLSIGAVRQQMRRFGDFYHYDFLRCSYHEYYLTQTTTSPTMALHRQPLDVMLSLYLEAATCRPWPELLRAGRELAAIINATGAGRTPEHGYWFRALAKYEEHMYLPQRPGLQLRAYIEPKTATLTAPRDHTLP